MKFLVVPENNSFNVVIQKGKNKVTVVTCDNQQNAWFISKSLMVMDKTLSLKIGSKLMETVQVI